MFVLKQASKYLLIWAFVITAGLGFLDGEDDPALLGISRHAGAASPPVGENAVRRVESDWVNALNRSDVKAIETILAPDFVRPSPESGMFVDRAQVLAFYGAHLNSHHAQRLSVQGETVQVIGSVAVARGIVTRTNQSGQVVWRALFTDVFAKRHGKWQAVSAQENQITAH